MTTAFIFAERRKRYLTKYNSIKAKKDQMKQRIILNTTLSFPGRRKIRFPVKGGWVGRQFPRSTCAQEEAAQNSVSLERFFCRPLR